MTCTYPVTIEMGRKVPCGRCLACRIQKASEWTLRLSHELMYWEKSCFLTLTYNEDNLPEGGTLVKKDLQNFFRSIRKVLGKKIKYYASGEYGDIFKRAHYHAIVFGLGFSTKSLVENVDKKVKARLKDDLESIWNKGFVHIGTVNPHSMRYCADYVHKKLFGRLQKETYQDVGLIPPFQLQSSGIGKRYAIDNKEMLKRDLFCTLGGVKHSLPRYYLKILGIDDEDRKKMDDLASDKYTELYSFHAMRTKGSVADVVESIKRSRIQYDKNLNAKNRIFGRSIV